MQRLGIIESKERKYVISIRQDNVLNIIASAAVFALLIVFYLYYLIDYSFLNIRLISTGIVAIICIIASVLTKGYRKFHEALWYVLLMIASWIIGAITNDVHYSNGTYLYCSVCYYFISEWFIRYNKKKSIPYEALFYCVFATVLYKVYVQHISILRIIQDGSSYNYISVVGMFFYLISNLVRLQENKSISLVQSICFLILTITGFGRGGIIVGFLLLFLVVFNNYFRNRSKSFKVLISILGIGLIIIIVTELDAILGYILGNTSILGKFAIKGTFNGDRGIIWSSYLQDIIAHPLHLLFGGNTYSIRVDGNLHNSFLQMHAQYGLIFLLSNIIILIKLIKKLYMSRNYELIILLTAFIVRCFTDRLLYHGFSELIYYIFVNYTLVERNFSAEDKNIN